MKAHKTNSKFSTKTNMKTLIKPLNSQIKSQNKRNHLYPKKYSNVLEVTGIK